MNNYRLPMNSRDFREAVYTGRSINGPINNSQNGSRPTRPSFSYRAESASHSRFDVGPHGERSRVISLPTPRYPSQQTHAQNKRPEEYLQGRNVQALNTPNLFSMGQTGIIAAQQITTTFAKALNRVESRFPSAQQKHHRHDYSDNSSQFRDKSMNVVKRTFSNHSELKRKGSRTSESSRSSTFDKKKSKSDGRDEKFKSSTSLSKHATSTSSVSKPVTTSSSVSKPATSATSTKTSLPSTLKPAEEAIKLQTPAQSCTLDNSLNNLLTATPQTETEKDHVLYVRRSDGFVIDSQMANYIQDSLIDLIYGDESGQPPTFHDSGLSDDSQFMVTCADERSASWLKNNATRIPTHNNIAFTAVEKQTLRKYKVFFSRKKSTDLPTILVRLKRSNKDLKIDCWSSELDKESDEGVALTFGLDQKSEETLKACNFEPFFELSRVKFVLAPNQPSWPIDPYIPGGPVQDKPQQSSTTVKADSSNTQHHSARSSRSSRY